MGFAVKRTSYRCAVAMYILSVVAGSTLTLSTAMIVISCPISWKKLEAMFDRLIIRNLYVLPGVMENFTFSESFNRVEFGAGSTRAEFARFRYKPSSSGI
jgi:hypothetical protein